ncbi:MAG: adenine deaminase [Dehalococcoidia bacterium]
MIEVARGDRPADLVLANARIVNVFTGEVEEGDVAVYDGRIAGVGESYRGAQTVDLKRRYLLPGFISGHTHIESSLLNPSEYARAVLPHGTTTVVTDLHEVANVSGLWGLEQILGWATRLPLDIFLMVPSCVPATDMETAGACLTAEAVAQALALPNALGLGEVMNFPGVVAGYDDCLAKVEAVGEAPVDGHAPGLRGKALSAYLAAGPRSDHETTTLAEGQEKLRRGMWLMIREGTSAKNLEELLPLVDDTAWPRCMFVVDDRSCVDLLHDGDVDAVVRKAVRLGLDPIRAVQLVTISPATYFRLRDRGAIGPGYMANLIVAEDLRDLWPLEVYHAGRLVAREGKASFSADIAPKPGLTCTVHVKPLPREALALPARGTAFPVIEVIPRQIITRRRMEPAAVKDGHIVPDVGRDILKLVVVERHRATGNVGVGLVTGFGLKQGAIGSTFAHDSHNIVVAGTNDDDIQAAVQELERMQGGLVVVAEGNVMAALPLPIAGLLSAESLETTATRLQAVEAAAASLGAAIPAPFAVLSFVALPVIPSLRLTDKGLVDVERGAFFDFSAVA